MTVSAQTPAADTFNPSAALPLGAANAMAPNPASAAVSNATPSAPANPLLAPEVGSGEWGKALGQQVIQMGHAGHQVAELQLNPPGLGPLKVTLSMDDHQIQAMFVSAHASVRAAVEAALPQLRTTLADNGISLGNTSVSADSQQQAAFTQGQNGQANHRAYPNGRLPTLPANLTPTLLTEPLRHAHGITVDTYA
jgi:flagellar hook-length control protein FliK